MQISRCISVRYRAGALLAALVLALPISAATARAASEQHPQRGAALSGQVVDASGTPASGAQVSAERGDGLQPIRVQADAAGSFTFPSLEPGSYTVRAASPGMASTPVAVAVEGEAPQQAKLVLHPADPAASGIEFTDQPSFTVAGVTDWTAVGGHGSDATLRTSEELNREALALRARAGNASGAKAESEAETRLRAAVAASPQSYEANRDLGLLYLNGSDFTHAVEPLQAALRIGGGKPEDEYHLALALEGAGDSAAALNHVQNALQQKDAGDFHRLAGEAEEKLGHPLAAVQQDERATQLDPSEANYFAWGTELLVHRAIWQAAGVLAKGAKAYPASVRLHTAWGAVLYAGALYDEAAARICEASDLDPAAREPYVFAGQIALATPTADSCIGQKLERFLASRPDDAGANYFYAMFLLKSPGAAPDQARQLLLRAVALDPTCSDGYLQLGILAAAHKDYPAAIAYYRDALRTDPQNAEAHYRLGIAYDRTGDPAGAKAEYALHDQMNAANAALVEQQRREVKQFSIANKTPGTAPQ